MNYKLLDGLDLVYGACEFRMATPATGLVAKGAALPSMQRRHFCADKNSLAAESGLKSAPYMKCSDLEVLSGRMPSSCGKASQVLEGKPNFGKRRLDDSGNGSLEVIETDFATDPLWNPFVTSHPRGLIYHHSLWLSALREEYGQDTLSLACVNEKGEFEGVFPMFLTRGLPCGLSRVGGHFAGRRLSSLPRTPLAGPLGTSSAVNELLLREAVRRVKNMPGTTLQVKVDTNELEDMVDGVRGTFWRDSYVTELPGPGRTIRFGNSRQHHKVAWAVNKAVHMGVKLRQAEDEEDLAGWYRLYLETMQRVMVLPRPYRFFQSLWRTMRSRGMMRLLLAEIAGNCRKELLAGSILLTSRDTLHYAFTGCNSRALSLHANDLLQWETIHSASKDGFRYYDFGEVGAERPDLARFKAKWSAKIVPLYRYHYPAPDSLDTHTLGEPADSRWAREIWQHLPLGLTEVFGDWIFRRL